MTTDIIDDSVNVFTRGPGAKLLVIAARNHLRQRARPTLVRKRTVTAPGAPADFADAVADVFAPSHVRTVAMASDVSDEKIGEEFSTRPYLY